MDSPVLDELGSGGLGFLDFLQDGSQDKCMDVELPDLLNMYDSSFPLQPAASIGRSDRGHLLRTAFRSHQEDTQDQGPMAGSISILDTRSSVAPVVADVSNNAVASAVSAPPAARATATAPLPQKSSVMVKSEPVSQQMQAYDSDSDEATGQSGKGGSSKRRRRIRNAKQQELNRLAQQRYRERKKQKYHNLQDTVDELSVRLGQLNTLEAANSELQQRNTQLDTVVKEQHVQLRKQQDTIARQAQQLQTQAQQLHHQAQTLQQQVKRIEQQDQQVGELKQKVAGLSVGRPAAAATPTIDAEQLNDQIALAVRAVLTGVSSMTSMLPAKDAQQMQQMVTQLPDNLLQQIRSCCREVALHLKKTEVKEQPHAIQVPCC